MTRRASSRPPRGPAGGDGASLALLRLFVLLRPIRLGLTTLVLSLMAAWITYDHARPAGPRPGDHAWWHSSEPARQSTDTSPGVFIALVVVAFYLLLPVLALSARWVCRLTSGTGRWKTGPAAFAVVATLAGAAVTASVTAFALVPAGGAGPSASHSALAALFPCAVAVALALFAFGVPWTTAGTGRPSTEGGLQKREMPDDSTS